MTGGLDEVLNPWPDPPRAAKGWDEAPAGPRGGAEFAALHAAQRLVQDRLTGAALPAPMAKEVTEQLLDLADLLAEHQMAEPDRIDGWRPDLPGRGHPLLPPYVIDE